MVAAGVGGDVLDTTAFGDKDAPVGGFDDKQFNLALACAELIVMRSGGGEGRLVIWDETQADAGFFQGIFQDNAGFLDSAR